MKTSYEYLTAIENILDDALRRLSKEAFETLLDGLSMIIGDYELDCE